MRKGSLYNQYSIFLAAGTLGAHAATKTGSFRQRDVRFLVELFSNWLEVSLPDLVLSSQNVQISRWLTYLTTEGYARRLTGRNHPHYRLTRPGLVQLLKLVCTIERVQPFEYFLFQILFIRCYGGIFRDLVTKEGHEYPPALRHEVENFLDEEKLQQNFLTNINERIKRLEERLLAAKSAAKLARSSLAHGKSLEEVTATLQRKHPYQLNSQVSLGELMRWLGPEIAAHELTTGTELRAEALWHPLLLSLNEQKALAKTLVKEVKHS